jgi:cytochrome c oxidase subunit III
MESRYAVEARPDTGLHNAKLGVWLFIASEVMLFAGLFSAYVLIRTGSSAWPQHDRAVVLGALNTAILIASSMTMVLAWAALKTNDWAGHRRNLALTILLGTAFLAVKSYEYVSHLRAGERPSTDIYLGLYFTLTGLHALHIVGGLVVLGYFLGPGASLWRRNPEQFANRIEATGLYWHFVDMLWMFLFPLLYLL